MKNEEFLRAKNECFTHSISFLIALLFAFCFTPSFSADIPQNIAYVKIYDFLDELAIDGVIEINSVVKPYSRQFIADKLVEAKQKENQLNSRQQKDLDFYLNDYALELNKLPEAKVNLLNRQKAKIALIQPAFHYLDSFFKCRITPILGTEVFYNKNGIIANRTVGAEIQTSIWKYVSIYGSLSDKAFVGELLSQPNYLNDFPGYQYKESTRNGADYSESRGGIKLGTNWGSIGLVKDKIIWGDNYNGSNILSGRVPSFPMVTLQLKPVKWFQLDYFHGWLVSNVKDSTYYYMEDETKHYRPANKFMAANMLTFTPVKKLNIAFGNSIIYSERNVQAAYFIPIAFYKSIDHTLTKGLSVENQNSQFFFNISSRNIKHVHLYTSVFIDEFSFGRLKKSNPEINPISYKLGVKLSNFPIQNLYVLGEYTHSSIINYKHSIATITWTSNSYNLGHYLGDNAQEIYFELGYKPVRGLNVSLFYLNAKHGNDYDYFRKNIRTIISQEFMKDVVWTNETFAFKANYEIFNNAYVALNVQYSNIQGHNPKSEPIQGEVRLDSQGYLDLFTPKYLQGKNITAIASLNIGF